MINSFSCAVGSYDAFLPGLSEALVTRPGNGAVAALSATRESYPGPNVALARAFYAQVFGDSGNGVPTVGEALRDAKNLRVEERGALNDAKYNLLGEPVLRLRRSGLTLGISRRPILFEQTVAYRDGRFSMDYFFPSRLPFGDTAAVRRLHVRAGSGATTACRDGADGKGPRIHIAGC